jgi:hypothetical protein
MSDDSDSENDDGAWVDSADRKVALRALAEHHAEDRLPDGEHDRRRDLVRTARTRADLRALFADLPPPHPLIGAVPVAGGAGSGLGAVVGSGGLFVLGALLAGWWVPATILACLVVVVALVLRRP